MLQEDRPLSGRPCDRRDGDGLPPPVFRGTADGRVLPLQGGEVGVCTLEKQQDLDRG